MAPGDDERDPDMSDDLRNTDGETDDETDDDIVVESVPRDPTLPSPAAVTLERARRQRGRMTRRGVRPLSPAEQAAEDQRLLHNLLRRRVWLFVPWEHSRDKPFVIITDGNGEILAGHHAPATPYDPQQPLNNIGYIKRRYERDHHMTVIEVPLPPSMPPPTGPESAL